MDIYPTSAAPLFSVRIVQMAARELAKLCELPAVPALRATLASSALPAKPPPMTLADIESAVTPSVRAAIEASLRVWVEAATEPVSEVDVAVRRAMLETGMAKEIQARLRALHLPKSLALPSPAAAAPSVVSRPLAPPSPEVQPARVYRRYRVPAPQAPSAQPMTSPSPLATRAFAPPDTLPAAPLGKAPPPPLSGCLAVRMGWRMRRRRFRRGFHRRHRCRHRWLQQLRVCLTRGSMGERLRACGDELGVLQRPVERWSGRVVGGLWARESTARRRGPCVRVAYGEGVGRSRSGPTSIRCVASRMPPQA